MNATISSEGISAPFDWMKIIVVGGILVLPIPGILDGVTDICSQSPQVITCQPSIPTPVDGPEHDHVPVPLNGPTTVTPSSSTSLSPVVPTFISPSNMRR